MNSARRAVVAGLVFAGFASGAWAAEADAVAPIQALNQALLASMKSGKQASFAQRFATLSPVIERAFDLPAILAASVGLRWASMSPADQQSLLAAFRKFTVASYVANFSDFGGEKIEIAPGSRMIGPDQVVGTVLTSSGETTPIDYVMHRSADGWRAIDVLLNGSISQVAVNRSDWRSLLATGPGPLITSLQRRTATLSGGAIN